MSNAQEDALLQRSLAGTYMAEGDYAQMLGAANTAVGLLTPLARLAMAAPAHFIGLSDSGLTPDDMIELLDEFAQSLDQRGIALKGLSRFAAADRDFDLAIAIFRANQEQDSLAVTLNNRGNSFLAQQRWEAAVADYSECIAIRRRRFAANGAPELHSLMAGTLKNRASAYWRSNVLDEALRDITEAAGIRKALIENEKLVQFRAAYAMTLYTRAQILGARGRPDEGLGDLAQAVALLEGMIAEGQTHLAGDLEMCKRLLAGQSAKGNSSGNWLSRMLRMHRRRGR